MGTERHRVVINRLMRTVITLHDSQRGLTEKNLENELGYSRSTIYRDLKSLQEMDIGLQCDTIFAAIVVRRNEPSGSISVGTGESTARFGL